MAEAVDIKALLEQLGELRAQLDLLEIEKQQRRDEVLTPEVRQQLEDIEVEFSGMAEGARKKAAELEAMIKQAVLAHGESVRGGVYQAVYVKGRTSWDSKKLERLMMVIPQGSVSAASFSTAAATS